MKRSLCWVILIVVVISGCYPKQYAIKDDLYEKLREAPAPRPSPASGSLWVGESNRNMLFADNKAAYLGDIITIVVNETSSAKTKRARIHRDRAQRTITFRHCSVLRPRS